LQPAGRFILKGRVMKIMIEENCDGAILAKLIDVLQKSFGVINIATYQDYEDIRYITIETADPQ
jgi:hypothetical protein